MRSYTILKKTIHECTLHELAESEIEAYKNARNAYGEGDAVDTEYSVVEVEDMGITREEYDKTINFALGAGLLILGGIILAVAAAAIYFSGGTIPTIIPFTM